MPSEFDIRRIHQQVEDVRSSCRTRDRDTERVRMVRRGEIELLAPEFFADDLPKSVVANIIDVAARDQAELMAPLPALACSSGNMVTTRDRERSAAKNKVGNHYWEASRLALNNIKFADSLNSYSFGTYIVDPNFEKSEPRIRFESSFGAYYFKNRWGDLVWYAKETEVTVGELVALYPDKRAELLREDQGFNKRNLSDKVKKVLFYDKNWYCCYLPDENCMVLVKARNPLSRVPVVIAERPDTEAVPRGQYDDVVWPALAKARMAQYMLKAADFAVNAPWAMPNDVTEISIGPDAVLRSDTPEKIGKIPLRIPQDVFVLAAELDSGTKEGARYPEARTGGIQGNIVTGRGVQELMGTMDTQVRTMQSVIGEALEEVTSLCFEMDEALWPNQEKKIEGVLTGKPYELTYKPAKAIAGSWHVKVTYGFASGQSPAQAIVALLQLRGDDQISRDTARRQLPFDIDPDAEQSQVDSERFADSILQGLSAWAQAMGPMAMQGQDPSLVLKVTARAMRARRMGTPIEDAVLDAFEEAQAEEAEKAAQQAAPEGGLPGSPQDTGGLEGGPEGELPPGIRAGGLTQGVAYGQQGMPPGGMPDIQSLMASLRGGQEPRMEATTMVKRPTG